MQQPIRLLLVGLLLSNFPTWAQVPANWARNISGTSSQYVRELAAGPGGESYTVGYSLGPLVLGATTTPVPATELLNFIAKYDAAGTLLWSKVSPSSGFRKNSLTFESAAVDAAGTVSVAGSVSGTVSFEGTTLVAPAGQTIPVLLRFNSAGGLSSVTKLTANLLSAGGSFRKIAVAATGDLYLVAAEAAAGTDLGAGSPAQRTRLLRYSAGGAIQFDAEVATGAVSINALTVTGNAVSMVGDYDGAGTLNGQAVTPTGGVRNMFLLRFGLTGTFQSSLIGRPSGSTYSMDATAISADAAGNVYVTGSYSGASATLGNTNLPRPAGSQTARASLYVASVTPAGTVQWARSDGSAAGDVFPRHLRTDAAGNYYVTGVYYNTPTLGQQPLTSRGQEDIFTTCYTAAGLPLWVQTVGTAQHDYPVGLNVDEALRTVVAGVYGEPSSVPGGVASVQFGSLTLTTPDGFADSFVAQYTPQALAARPTAGALSGLHLAPNPASNSGAVWVTGLAGQGQLTVLDLLGRPVLERPFQTAQTAVPLTGLAPGVYLVQAQSDQAQQTTRLEIR